MDETQDTQTPTPDIEPPTVGNSEQAYVTAPATIATNNRPTAPAPAPTEQKKHRWPRVLAITMLAVLLVAGAGVASFYYLYRTPNSAYDEMLKELYVMRESATTIPLAKEISGNDSYLQVQDPAKKKAADAYIASLAKVKRSPILERDNTVRREYDSDKAKVEAYGKSSLDLIKTSEIYHLVDTVCRQDITDLRGNETVQEFDKQMQACNDLLVKHPTVPLKEFNEIHYKKLIDAFKGVIESYRTAYVAFNDRDEYALEKAYTEMGRAEAVFRLATSGSPNLSNTHNPSESISRIIAAVEKRKTAFFRH